MRYRYGDIKLLRYEDTKTVGQCLSNCSGIFIKYKYLFQSVFENKFCPYHICSGSILTISPPTMGILICVSLPLFRVRSWNNGMGCLAMLLWENVWFVKSLFRRSTQIFILVFMCLRCCTAEPCGRWTLHIAEQQCWNAPDNTTATYYRTLKTNVNGIIY